MVIFSDSNRQEEKEEKGRDEVREKDGKESKRQEKENGQLLC